MARPKQIDDQQLLDSLRETFLELGPVASTQELAKRAGVSEGTLFKRFGTKKKIFVEALRLPDLEDRAWFVGLVDQAGRGTIEETLVGFALGMRAFLDEIMPMLTVITAGGKHSPHEVACMLGETDPPPPLRTVDRFAQYFEREMELGRLRRVDPRALAWMFVGALSHDFHLRMHYPNHDFGDSEVYSRKIARAVIDLAGTSSVPADSSRAASKS